MADNMEPSAKYLQDHVAVRMKDCIVVISNGGFSEIWTYNLWTEHWTTKPANPDRKNWKMPVGVPITSDKQGVAIGSVIYIFGGSFLHEDMLWKLIMSTYDSFQWRRIQIEDVTKTPSRRDGHCAWQYEDKMWIFGGQGSPPNNFINKHGHFVVNPNRPVWNNQLLSFDPSIQTWEDVQYYGDIPSPRACGAAAITNHQVWLYGGYDSNYGNLYDFFNLNMHSFVWTKIGNGRKIRKRFLLTLTPITTNQLVLHSQGLRSNSRTTWIIDVQSNTWRKHRECNSILNNSCTSTTGLNKDVIVITHGSTQYYNIVFSVMLEPKTLQQLAMKLVFEHRTALPWESLPPKLKCKMMGAWE